MTTGLTGSRSAPGLLLSCSAAAVCVTPPGPHSLFPSRSPQALLRVRYSSPLFRMARAEHILQQLAFHNTGPNQVGDGAI